MRIRFRSSTGSWSRFEVLGAGSSSSAPDVSLSEVSSSTGALLSLLISPSSLSISDSSSILVADLYAEAMVKVARTVELAVACGGWS